MYDLDSFCLPMTETSGKTEGSFGLIPRPRLSAQLAGSQNKASPRSLDQRSSDPHGAGLLKADRRQTEKNRFYPWEARQTSPGLSVVYIVDRV